MPGFNIFVSNRQEILADQLAQVVRMPLSSPICSEIIVVQSRGMERWISLELARRNGIWANCSFPFPNVFLEDIFKRFMPDLPERSPWDPDILTFTIMKILPTCIDREGFDSLKIYFENQFSLLKLFQLSKKIADTFDQYLIFRPELIFSWEEGRARTDQVDSWQAQLWRELIRSNGPQHRARLRKDLLKKITRGSAEIANLPERVSIFGVSYLPRFHLETFAALSRFTQMNLFLLNPCREYWADIVSDKAMPLIKRKYFGRKLMAEDLHYQEGNRLLASMGTVGKDFFSLVENLDHQVHEWFEERACQNMLACIQSDILNLKNRQVATSPDSTAEPTASPSVEPLLLSPGDTSIQVHCCHSPMREIEVLHDSLLAMFEEDPDLRPQDIIVMAPDIETYAPFVHAVFDAQIRNGFRIPFSIADRSARKESRIIEGFLALLDLKDSRLGATQVLGLLEFPSIRENFGLTDSDIHIVEAWTKHTQIRWGKDDEDRLKCGLPRFSDNSWRSGVKRLLLGYAMPGYNREMFHAILPFDHIEGKESQILGKFLEFIERVFRIAKILEHPKSLSRWRNALQFMVEQFFPADEESEREIQTIRHYLDELADRQWLSGFDEKIELEVVKAYLCQNLEKNSFSSGFMSRGVTFCAMLPMRSIPFQVICLVGMNAEAFPRDHQPLSFDLIVKDPRPGDRSRRKDDKYLFLESIISARQKLYISYVGRSIQDNSRMQPSALVCELLDTLERSFYLPGKNICDHVLTEHRLQPFSPFYFQDDSKLFSYSEEDMLAGSGSQNRSEPRAFISEKLPLTAPEAQRWKTIDLEDLCFFFSNPIKFLLKKRLGIFLDEATTILKDRENFNLDPLTRYAVEQSLVNHRLLGADLQQFRSIQRATGELPAGNIGDAHYNKMSIDVDQFVVKIKKYADKKISDPLDVKLEISDFHLQGRLPDLYELGYVRLRYAACKAKDLLRSWIYHLVYSDLQLNGFAPNSFLICKDKALKFNNTPQSITILDMLLKIFWRGLTQPLHFFPETSLTYIQQLRTQSDARPKALLLAKRKWMGSDYHRGESKDPYYQLCFHSTDPIDESFEEIARHVYLPLLKDCEQIVL